MMDALRRFSIGLLLCCLVFIVPANSGWTQPSADAVSLDEAFTAALTYQKIGEAQYPQWSDRELFLVRTYYDLDSEPSAFEFSVGKAQTPAGYIIIGGSRRFPPLIEYSNGPSPVKLAIERGFVQASPLTGKDARALLPVYVGGLCYFALAGTDDQHLVELASGHRFPLQAVKSFAEDFMAASKPSRGIFARMWQAALAPDAVVDRGDYRVLAGAEGYTWYRGCGPTSGTMVLGYYGKVGYRNLKYEAQSFEWHGPTGTSWPYIPRALADMVADMCGVPRQGGNVEDYGVYESELALAIERVAQAHGYKGFQCYIYPNERDYSIYQSKIDEGDPSIFGITKMDPGPYDNHAIMGYGYNYTNPTAGHLAVVYDTWSTKSRTAAMESFITYRLVTIYSPLISEQDVELSSESYNFGEVPIGSFADWVLRIGNTGAIPLLVNRITSSQPSFFCTTPGFPLTIAGGESVLVNVRFQPDKEGRITGTLTVETDDPDPNEEFCKVSVSGKGLLNARPIVEFAGFGGQPLSAGESGYISVQAKVDDPDGADQIESVWLFVGTIQGEQLTSLQLFDDGQHQDGSSADGLFGNRFWVESAPQGSYIFEIVAYDSFGACSDVWPYFTVSGAAERRRMGGRTQFFGKALSRESEQSPLVLTAGFDHSSVSEQHGGKLVCLADISHPLGLSQVQRVELRYHGTFTGVLLKDDGQGDDEQAGDGRFTGTLNVGPGCSAGEYLLEIVAIDKAGHEGLPFPYYVVK